MGDPVADFLAAHQGRTQAATAPPSDPVAAFLAKRQAAAPTGNPFLSAGKKAASVVGSALDAQRWGVAKVLTGESDTNAQMTKIRSGMGVEGAYQAAGQIPVIGHALQGAADVGIQTGMDPLTYETLFAAPAMKALGVAGKVGPAALKAMDATPLGRRLYDFMNWGGPVAREHGADTVDMIRGAAHLGSATAMRVQEHLVGRFEQIVKPLSNDERVVVAKALNGELPIHELPSEFSPRLRSAYRQLRTLTEMDFKLRTSAARSIAFKEATKDLSEADRSELAKAFARNAEPVVPQPVVPRVKTPYGEPVARTRTKTDIPAHEIPADQIMRDAMTGLPDAEQKALRMALYHQTPRGLSEPLKQRFQTVSEALSAKMYGVPGEKQILQPAQRYTLPHPNQPEIERMTKLRDTYKQIAFQVEQAMPRREHYMPWAHESADEGGLAARKFNLLDVTKDPRTIERPNLEVTNASQLGSGFEAMAKNTGRQVERAVVRDALGELVNDPEVHKLFERTMRATGDKRTDWDKIKGAWMATVGYPRAATVSLTPRHAVNILDLLANTVGPPDAPRVLKDTMTLAARLAHPSITPKQYAALTQEGRQLGALSGEFRERKPFFQTFPEWAPGVGGKKVPVLSAWTRMNNRLVWAVDEAAKQTYAKLIVERGEAEGLRAGGMASKRLVDYSNTSPMVEALRYVAPFATFRGSIPGAVAGGIARNPARAALLDRATGGTMSGGQPEKSQDHGVKLFNPTADVGRMVGAPQEYLRSTLASPVVAAATLGQEALTGNPFASVKSIGQEIHDLPGQVARGQWGQIGQERKPSKYADVVALRHARYLNYRNPADLRWLFSAALAGIPEARDIITEMGAGQFKPRTGTGPERLGKDALQQVLGVGIR